MALQLPARSPSAFGHGGEPATAVLLNDVFPAGLKSCVARFERRCSATGYPIGGVTAYGNIQLPVYTGWSGGLPCN